MDEIPEDLKGDRDPPPISEATRRELDRRIALLDANSEAGTPWEEVKRRILARLQQ
jgi:putative addiction module component (TIGR02574 family)